MTATGKPLYFGPKNLFGWYHPPAVPSKKIGVVIVSPNGYDMVSMHWGWHCLAGQLSLAGFPVVRFDLHGTGDSPGDDEQPDRVQAWLESVHDAIELLKQQATVSQVVLLGTRLGGTLAAVAATSRDDVTGLILYSPCVSGRQYVRELKAMAAAARSTGGIAIEPESESDVLMAGWLLTEQTASELGKLDVTRMSFAGKQALYMHRGDTVADKRVVQALQSAANVVVEPAADYAAFAQDALFAKEPVNDFAAIQRWLESLPGDHPSLEHSPVVVSAVLAQAACTEQPLLFGADNNLFGILCEPVAHSAQCVVFINTAANHHVGAHRLAVELSRKLAVNGVASLRMDVGGIGDSPVREGRVANQVYNPEVADDVIAAVDALIARGINDITLTGICSGSYLAYHAAVKDARINSLALVNLQRFIWRDGDSLEIAVRTAVPSMGTYIRKALQWDTWKRIFTGGVDFRFLIPALTGKLWRKFNGLISRIRNAAAPSSTGKNEVAANCAMILQRGGRIRMIYSGDDGGLDEVAMYLGPQAAALRGFAGFRFEIISGADHTFTAAWARKALLEQYIRHCADHKVTSP